MLNEILNGALGESSSRSGSSSSSRSGNSFSAWQKKIMSANALSLALKKTSNSESGSEDEMSQQVSELPDPKVAAAERAMNDAIVAQYTSFEERAAAIRAAVENAARVVSTMVYDDEIAKGTNPEIAKREADRAEYAYYNEHWEPIRQAEIDVVNATAAATQPPQVVMLEKGIPMVSVAPSEDKGSSLLIPGIILALGVIGAIALTSKSKKRR